MWFQLSAVLFSISLHLGRGATTTTNPLEAYPALEDSCGNAEEKETAACPGVENFPDCVSGVDCTFKAWSDWSAPTDQQCTRSRAFENHAQDNGNGCTGNTKESKYCAAAGQAVAGDCVWGAWEAFSACANDLAQQSRKRPITSPATAGGAPCVGASEETKACGVIHEAIQCRLSNWNLWTSCSHTCGSGYRTRKRRIEQYAQFGGTPCTNYVLEVGECITTPCAGAVDCVLTPWSNWAGCEHRMPNQRMRHRKVVTPNQNGGKPCAGSKLEEVDDCSHVEDKCVFDAWGAWSACGATCGTSQSRRQRTLKSWLIGNNASACPDPVTQETKGCQLGSCDVGTDCQLSDWTPWGGCSAKCGTASQNRTRKIISEASGGGTPCDYQPLEQLQPCTGLPACVPVNCVWGLWSEWGACTATCGGGTARRTRRIATSPLYTGSKSCAETENDPAAQHWPFKQIGACNEQPCVQTCINGTYGDWNAWSSWSATCGTTYRSRKRDLAEVPNSCGYPAEGDEEEFVSEEHQPCVATRDCKLTVWSDWSACSSTCFGVRDRSRLVEQFATGEGKSCNSTALMEMLPCNPGVNEATPSSCEVLPNRSCLLSHWSQWMDCPVTCGGGQHQRARRVIQPPSGGGESCQDELTQTRTCNMNKCGSHCIDCHWGQWSDWEACSKCGGQRYRQRRVEQLPNHCGSPCETRSSQETSKCSFLCAKPRWCVWGEWSAFSQCSATCGGASKQRQRHLLITDVYPTNGNFLFKAYHHMMCAGTRFEAVKCTELQKCGTQACVPVDCAFSVWSQWYAPQMTGLCQRNRVIVKNNNECGTACSGNLIETKSEGCILDTLKPRNCEMTNWGDWSMCPAAYAQKYRLRGIFSQPANGGSADTCAGDLRVTANCRQSQSIVNCGFTPWSGWGSCSQTCGGLQYRTRQGNHPETKEDGEPCVGALREMRACSSTSCGSYVSAGTKDCEFGVWTEWGICFQGQKTRIRHITQSSAGSGAPCVGPLEDTEPCGMDKQDCKISPWTDWDACSEPSGGGQHMRHREVYQHPRFGGTPCPTKNEEIGPCNTHAATGNINCVLSVWTTWAGCTTQYPLNCQGQETRTRTIVHNRQPGGTGCLDPLIEARPCGKYDNCEAHQPPTDCSLTAWAPWTTCSRTCDTGWHSRSRDINVPSPQGKVCTGTPVLREAANCNTNRCDGKVCTDAVWGVWSAWGACSSLTCPGVQSRTRIIAQAANDCGKAAVGDSEETQACNADKDCSNTACVFNTWQAWSNCSQTCNGYTTRTRDFVDGTGSGAHCVGETEELAPCNPGTGQATPSGCPAIYGTGGVDCVWGLWQAWTTCSRQCDGGSQNRTRSYIPEQNHGKPCTGTSREVQQCNWFPCSQEKQNCYFDQWTDWSGCTSILNSADHGSTKRVQTRSRVIKQLSKNGGAPCDPKDAVEMREGTAPDCPPLPAQYCVWAAWASWSACSRTCGKDAVRSRSRKMTVTKFRRLGEAEEQDSLEEVEFLLPSRHFAGDVKAFNQEMKAFRQERLARQGDMHFQELLVAFAAGGAAMFLLLGIIHSCSGKATSVEASRRESDILSK